MTQDKQNGGGLSVAPASGQQEPRRPGRPGGPTPLVDLNGAVIGFTVTEAGSGLNIDGYAIGINTALAIAARIDASAPDFQVKTAGTA